MTDSAFKRRPPHQVKVGLIYFASVFVLLMALVFWGLTSEHSIYESLARVGALCIYTLGGAAWVDAYCRRNP